MDALAASLFGVEGLTEFDGQVYAADILARLADQGYVLVSVEGLARAIAATNRRTKLDDGFEWYASPNVMAEDIIAALKDDAHQP